MPRESAKSAVPAAKTSTASLIAGPEQSGSLGVGVWAQEELRAH
jgi:hypothetical protein